MNRFAMLAASFAATAGLALLLSVGGATGQQAPKFSKAKLLRGWVLVSTTVATPDGKKVESFGDNDGTIVFDANGRYSLILARADLPKFASNNRATGTTDENKAIVTGSLAFFGSYSLNEADGTLTMKVERSTFPNWVGTNQTRIIHTLTADELTWYNPASSVGGTAESIWR
jgi:hypothetical protein